jgi:hypothetical protein
MEEALHDMPVFREFAKLGDGVARLPDEMAKLAKQETGHAKPIVLADRGYFEGYEILECERAGIATLVPKPTVFGTLKAWMCTTHFLTGTLPRVGTEMSLQVLAYNLKRAIKIFGARELMTAMRAQVRGPSASRSRPRENRRLDAAATSTRRGAFTHGLD